MRRTLLLAAATHALTRKDFEYTYLLGDAVPTSNVDSIPGRAKCCGL